MNKELQTFKKIRILIASVIEGLSTAQLNEIPEGFNNNIIWNIGNVIVSQQSVIYGRCKVAYTIPDDLFPLYKGGTKPKHDLSSDETNNLKDLILSSVNQLEKDLETELFQNYQPFTHGLTNIEVSTLSEAFNFLIFHESLHLGYIMALKRNVV